MDPFFDSFKNYLKKSYPRTFERFGDNPPLSPYQVSPVEVSLPKLVLTKMRDGAAAFWSEARSLVDPKDLRPELGVCTSFDFHVNGSDAKLIEVNTNASLSLIFHALEDMRNLSRPEFLKELIDSFLNEHKLRTRSDAPPRIAIVDENVDQQKMRIEFHLFREQFERRGLFARVVDLKDLTWDASSNTLTAQDEHFDFVYNRHTDFYFASPDSAALRAAYDSGKVTITPNPSNYIQLADKKVLIELSKKAVTEPLREILLESYLASDFSADELWARRKDFFFKPLSSYGSKGVYKGKSISRKILDQIMTHDYIAQTRFSPGRVTHDGQEFKFDVRLITYGPHYQIAGARVYQGQLTNFATLGGGAAPIIWS